MNKLRWGLIGCGDISRKRVAPALRDIPECELVAVNRARVHLAAAFANEFGAKRWYGDWRELIADDEIDAVYIATPVYLHVEQTIAAAEAGKHVLCEKPMAMNAAECDRMIAACEASGVKLGVAYYRRFYPLIRRIRQVIASGEIGKPVIAQINAFERFNPQPGEDRYWLLEKSKSGGGPMMDFGCHRVEILINLFGAVTRTTGVVGSALFDRQVEDTCIAGFEFESGTQASLAVTHAAFESRDTLDIFCSAGSIHTPALNHGEIRIVTAAGEQIESYPTRANIHQPLIEDFTRAVLDGREPEVGGDVGRAVALIEEKIYAAEIERDWPEVKQIVSRYEEAPAVCHDYDPRAPQVAVFMAQAVNRHLADVIVEHVGSTSVPGCAGKGVIDLMVIYHEGRLEPVKTLLDAMGFQRQTTRDPFPESRPMRTGSIEYDGAIFRVHAHVIAADSPEVEELRLFRDRLRADQKLVAYYVARKQVIIGAGVTDSIEYSMEKGDFIREVMQPSE